MRTYRVSRKDLSGLISQGTRIYMAVSSKLINDPTAERRQWRYWCLRVAYELSIRPIRARQVPECHRLGTKPQGYDWVGSECDTCSSKLTCIMSEKDPPSLEVDPKDSSEAILMWATNKPEPRMKARGLTRPNPAGNYLPNAIWGLYPSGMIMPRVNPKLRPAGDARLYRIEIHCQDDVPALFVTGVYRADSALEMLGFKSYKALEVGLEDDWKFWKDVEMDVDPLPHASALGASGNRQHVYRHVLYDLQIENGQHELLETGRSGSWVDWAMDLQANYREERHSHAKRIRREGQTVIVGPRQLHERCRACTRLRKPSAG